MHSLDNHVIFRVFINYGETGTIAVEPQNLKNHKKEAYIYIKELDWN